MEGGSKKAEQRELEVTEGQTGRAERSRDPTSNAESARVAGLYASTKPQPGSSPLPAGIPPAILMRLQRAAGNRAVASLVSQMPLQRSPDADAGVAVADQPQTLTKPDQAPTLAPPVTPPPPSGQIGPPTTPAAGPAAPPPPAAGAGGEAVADHAAAPVPMITGPAAEEFAVFAARVADMKALLLQSSRTTKQRIKAASDLEKTNLQGAAATEQGRVNDAYAAAIDQVKQGFLDTQTSINGKRDAEILAVQDGAKKQLADLSKATSDQQSALSGAAEEQATAATRAGEDEATRAVRQSRLQGVQAVDIGSAKGRDWQSHDRGPEIARVAGDMATELAKGLVDNGNAMAAQARKDAASLASKFRSEAKDSAAKFAEGQRAGESKITSTRDQSIQKINDLAKEPVAKLQKQSTDLVGQLEAQRADVGQQFQAQAIAARASVDKAVSDALGSIDGKTSESTSALDDALSTLAGKIQGVSRQHAKKAFSRAAADLVTEIAAYDTQMGAFAQQTEKALESGAADFSSKLTDQAGRVINPAKDAATKFVGTAQQTAGSTVDEIGKTSGQASKDMEAVVQTTSAELGRVVDASRKQWQQDLTNGVSEIKTKVDKGLAEGAKEVDALAAKIDQKGHDIESESWLSRAWEFTKGFLAGFFKALGQLVLILLIVALAVIVVLAVVLLVAAAIGGIWGVLAVIAAIGAAIEAIAGVLAVIAIIVAVVIVLIAVFKIIKALTQGNLTDYERGQLWGSAVFDIATIFFGAKAVKWVAQWVEALRGAEDVAELGELRAMVADEELLQRLLKLTKNDGASLKALLQLLNKDGVMAEKLLILTGSDSARLTELLNLCGKDGAVLEKVLIAAGQDMDKTAKLLRLCNKNPATVSELMDLADNNPDRILELFEKNGGDAGKVLDELRQAKAVAEMISELEKVGVPRDYLDKLSPDQLKALKTALSEWNLDPAGKNQGFTHVIDYSEGGGGAGKTNRLTSLTDYTGKGPFDPNDPAVIRDVTRALDELKAAAKSNPQNVRDLGGGKFLYFSPKVGVVPTATGFSKGAKGIIIIEVGGKYSSFFNGTFGRFLTLN